MWEGRHSEEKLATLWSMKERYYEGSVKKMERKGKQGTMKERKPLRRFNEGKVLRRIREGQNEKENKAQ